MRIAEAAEKNLADGFAAIVAQFQLPRSFPEAVLEDAKSLRLDADIFRSDRRDATHLPMVTLDPATSTDLDQAFYLDVDGDSIVLHYALADVGALVASDVPIDQEAWRRGVTIYGLSRKIPLYPEIISQHAASLLPIGPRPAILVVVAISPEGSLELRKVERVVCRSRAKLAYDSVDLSTIPHLEEFARRMNESESQRGAVRIDTPKQEVIVDESAPGNVRLVLRGRLRSEEVNASLSLAVNLALGALMKDARIGLFRTMEEPRPAATMMLRRIAHTLNIRWNHDESLRDLQRRLDPTHTLHQQFFMEARRAGGRARYSLFDAQTPPWHAAIAAPYVHATAPMRRLADRYVLDLALHLMAGTEPPDSLRSKLEELPHVMNRSETRASNVDRAVIDLIEAVSLQHRIGEVLDAEVVDADNGIVQTFDSAIRSKALRLPPVDNGSRIQVRIEAADPVKRSLRLAAIIPGVASSDSQGI